MNKKYMYKIVANSQSYSTCNPGVVVSSPVETLGTTVKQLCSIRLNILAETEISSDLLPIETPKPLKLEEIREYEKDVNELTGCLIPVVSKFFYALRRMALCMTSSSVAPAPSFARAYLPLRLTVG
jgi:hypothetical protein